MATLNTNPRSVTIAQMASIHYHARERGMDRDALHAAAGVASLRELSAAEASALITRLGGGDLQHPPGQAPVPSRRRRTGDATRMITPDHVDQICRLGLAYFGGGTAKFAHWLEHNYYEVNPRDAVADQVRDLATAERAGEIIAALKRMRRRRERRASRPAGGHAQPSRDRKGVDPAPVSAARVAADPVAAGVSPAGKHRSDRRAGRTRVPRIAFDVASIEGLYTPARTQGDDSIRASVTEDE